jgi:mannosyl-glycoprotein endo-beta-N-acetylglucosaminidase
MAGLNRTHLPNCVFEEMAPVSAVAAALEQLPADERTRDALTTVQRILSNAISKPDDSKYRRLKLENKLIAGTVVSCPGAVDLLLAAGFNKRDGELVLPAEAPGLALVHVVASRALAQLPATMPPAPGRAQPPALTRVCGGKGWVVHGLVLEFADGSRAGAFLENDGSRIASLRDDEALARRGGSWNAVAPGERVVRVMGAQSAMGYLCGSVALHLSSGRVIAVQGDNPSAFGPSFEWAVPSDAQLAEVIFDDKGAAIEIRMHGQAAAPPPARQGPAAGGAPLPPARVLHTIRQLLAWTPPIGVPAAVRAQTAPHQPLPARPRTMHCHDMQGGYNARADAEYLEVFDGWHAIDVFCYFGHHRVSMPPKAWVDACHARGVPCLGTLITEDDTDGENLALLSNVEGAVEALCSLAEHHGFDGYLINFEASVPAHCLGQLHELLALLTVCLKQRIGEQALVIYYDSLDSATGAVRYANALSPTNQSLFESCDGVFTNYWWDARELSLSAELSLASGGRDRRADVYMGVDVFARNTSYRAGLGCAAACRSVHEHSLSLALFAPGWSFEAAGLKTREEDRQFWEQLQPTRARSTSPRIAE